MSSYAKRVVRGLKSSGSRVIWRADGWYLDARLDVRLDGRLGRQRRLKAGTARHAVESGGGTVRGPGLDGVRWGGGWVGLCALIIGRGRLGSGGFAAERKTVAGFRRHGTLYELHHARLSCRLRRAKGCSMPTLLRGSVIIPVALSWVGSVSDIT